MKRAILTLLPFHVTSINFAFLARFAFAGVETFAAKNDCGAQRFSGCSVFRTTDAFRYLDKTTGVSKHCRSDCERCRRP